MPVKTFELPELGTVHIYKRTGVRNIRLSMNSEGRIRVTMPTWAPYKAGLLFVTQKQDWLLQQKQPVLEFESGSRIGKYHTVRFVKGTSLKSRVGETDIVITHPASKPIASKEVQTTAKKAAERALRQEGEQLLPKRLKELAAQHDLSFNGVSVRQLKSRWGSCSSKKDITLNYYLMQLPWEQIDYVLVHELAHTEHLNHSQRFWQTVEIALPNYKQRRKILKEYQPSVLAPKNTRSMA